MNRLVSYPGSSPYRRAMHKLIFGEYDPVWSIGWRLEPADATEATEVPFIHEVVSHPQLARQLLVKDILTTASVTGKTRLFSKHFHEFERLLEATAAANVFVNNQGAFEIAIHGLDKQTQRLAHTIVSIYEKHSQIISGEIEFSNLPEELRELYQPLRAFAKRQETEHLIAPSRHRYSVAVEFMLPLWLEPSMCSSQYPPSSFVDYLGSYDDALESAIKGREVSSDLVPVEGACSDRDLAHFLFVLSMTDMVMEGGDLAQVAISSLLDSLFDLQRQFLVYLVLQNDKGGSGLSAKLCEEAPLFGRLTRPGFIGGLKPLDSARLLLRRGHSIRHIVQWELCHKYFVFDPTIRDMLIRRRGLRRPTVPRMRERCCSIMRDVFHRLAEFYPVWKADRTSLGVSGEFFEALADDSPKPRIPNPGFWRQSKQRARRFLDSFDKRAFYDALRESLDAWLSCDTEILSFLETAENTARLAATLPIEDSVELRKLYGHDLQTWSPAGPYRGDKWRIVEEAEDKTVWSDGTATAYVYNDSGKRRRS